MLQSNVAGTSCTSSGSILFIAGTAHGLFRPTSPLFHIHPERHQQHRRFAQFCSELRRKNAAIAATTSPIQVDGSGTATDAAMSKGAP